MDLRINIAGTGAEWSLLPLFCVGGTDRMFFLLNALMFLSLPALAFVTARGLRLMRKPAWLVAWLVPGLAGAVLQAASVGNDLPGLFFFMSAMAFSVRVLKSRNWLDLICAVLSASLLTGVKASNILLVLPIAILLLPILPWLMQRRLRMLGFLALCVIAAPVSFLPIALSNQVQTGAWHGDPQDANKFQLKSPISGLLGNSLQVAANSLNPPVFPISKQWNEKVISPLYRTPTAPLHYVLEDFPRLELNSIEIQNEEYAGMGFGIFTVLCVAIVASLFVVSRGKTPFPISYLQHWNTLVMCAGGVAIILFFSKFGNESGPRIFLPFYPMILFPLFSMPRIASVADMPWFRVFSGFAVLTILPSVLITPSRPLISPSFLLQVGARLGLSETQILRMKNIYTTYSNRHDMLASVRDSLPPSESEIGWICCGNDPVVSLWLPYGSRKVIPIIMNKNAEITTTKNIPNICVVSDFYLRMCHIMDASKWASINGFCILSSHEATVTVVRGNEIYYIMQKNPEK